MFGTPLKNTKTYICVLKKVFLSMEEWNVTRSNMLKPCNQGHGCFYSTTTFQLCQYSTFSK